MFRFKCPDCLETWATRDPRGVYPKDEAGTIALCNGCHDDRRNNKRLRHNTTNCLVYRQKVKKTS